MERLRKSAGLFAFLLPFIIYLATLCPTVHWGDSGELITAAYTLGIPHPPGHPLFAILGKLFTLIPIGSVAWRVNFMSAFFGAMACYLIYKIICDLLGETPWRHAAAFGGAMFFAFAPTVWDQTTVAETTTLHVAFMMLLTLLGLRLTSGKFLWRNETRSLCLFSFLYGLSMTNHVAGIFFLPAFIYLYLSSFGIRILAPRLLGKMLFFVFLASLVYLYLPIRSLANPPLDWGNPETLSNFLWVVTARQFSPNLTTPLNLQKVAGHLAYFGKDLPHQFTALGCILGVIGAPHLFRVHRKYVVFTIIVTAILFYIGINSAFISAYFAPALALLSVFIGFGIERATELAPAVLRRIKDACSMATLQKAFCGVLAAGFVLPLGMNYREMDRSSDIYARRYGDEILSRLSQNSVLFTSDGYALFILWYLTLCEGERPDVAIINPGWLVGKSPLTSQVLEQYPGLRMPTLDEMRARGIKGKTLDERKFLAIQTILDENVDYRPVYWGIIFEELPFFDHLMCHGIVYSYSKAPVSLNESNIEEVKKFWDSELRFYRNHPEMKRTNLIIEAYPVELNNQGLVFERLGRDDLARWSIEQSLQFKPDYPLSHYNLGRLEARAGDYEGAIAEYKEAIKGNPYMAVAYYNMGNAYRSLNKFDEAFLAYRQATRFYKAYYEAMTALGQLYAMVGRHEDAVREFRKSLDIEPQYPFALRGLSSSYLALGKIPEAREALMKNLEFDPDSAPSLFLLAKFNARMGDINAAEQALQRCIDIGGHAYIANAASDQDLKALVRHTQSVAH